MMGMMSFIICVYIGIGLGFAIALCSCFDTDSYLVFIAIVLLWPLVILGTILVILHAVIGFVITPINLAIQKFRNKRRQVNRDMNITQIATALMLRELQCFSLKFPEDRALLQTKVFLAQELGVPLGFGFSWHISGPYSPDLTEAAYEIIREGYESLENLSLRERYMSIAEKVNALESQKPERGRKISNVSWYMLVAIVAYWYKGGFQTKKSIAEKIRSSSSEFTETQILLAYNAYMSMIQERIVTNERARKTPRLL